MVTERSSQLEIVHCVNARGRRTVADMENTSPVTEAPPAIHGFAYLHDTEIQLAAARGSALAAAQNLVGARATRCSELLELINDAIAFAHRLAFIVECDISTDLHQSSR